MFAYKGKHTHLFVHLCIILVAFVIQASSDSSSEEIVIASQENGSSSEETTPSITPIDVSDEISSDRWERDVNEATEEVKTTTPTVVLQPNIAGALDVGQGLLVPLVPVVDPNPKTDAPQPSPLAANLIPVTVKTNTDKTEIRRSASSRIDDDMDVAEDIVFRPLFRFRQEAQERLSRKNNYQPYVYAYKRPPSDSSQRYYSNNNDY